MRRGGRSIEPHSDALEGDLLEIQNAAVAFDAAQPLRHRSIAIHLELRQQRVGIDHEVELIGVVGAEDALAWAYFKAGRIEDAKKAIALALRTGTRDRDIRAHATAIGVGSGL